jgi:hypothetical protein
MAGDMLVFDVQLESIDVKDGNLDFEMKPSF